MRPLRHPATGSRAYSTSSLTQNHFRTRQHDQHFFEHRGERYLSAGIFAPADILILCRTRFDATLNGILLSGTDFSMDLDLPLPFFG